MNKKNLPVPLPRSAVPIMPLVGVADKALDLAQSYLDYQKIREVEQSKRAEIEAKREIMVTFLRNHREIREKAMSGAFAEREKIISELLALLRVVLESGNNETARDLLQSLATMATRSPLSELSNTEETQVMFQDPNSLFKI